MPAPPKVAAWLLRYFRADESLVGDLIERYERRPSAMWLWKQVLWAIAVINVQKIRTKNLRLSFQSTEFNPKALLVSVGATGAILYALEHPSGVVAVFVGAFLFGGLWRLIPDRWLTRQNRTRSDAPLAARTSSTL